MPYLEKQWGKGESGYPEKQWVQGESGCSEKQWGQGQSRNPSRRHGGVYGEKDSPRTEKSLAQLALNIGIYYPSTAYKALAKAKATASPWADRVYFSCKGHYLVWYKPENE